MTCRFWSVATFALLLTSQLDAATVHADQKDYRAKLKTLRPGDVLVLGGGDYTGGLTVDGLHGKPAAWITIKGRETGPRPRFLGDPERRRNTIQLRSASFVSIENLLIDGQDIPGIFGIDASGGPIHDIRIEGCTIVGHGASQYTVGISTKVPTWNWTIRRNHIIAAGTGMYLGNSDGRHPFVAGLIEHNLFEDARGYNMQIKHQIPRPEVPGMPRSPQRTIIRHNVFVKGELPNDKGPRPNLLLGGFPDSGPGLQDMYEVYGNVFYHNHREALLQAAGRVAIHDNLFMDCSGHSGIYLADHNGPIKVAYVYNNTFYVGSRGVRFGNTPREHYLVTGNLILMDAGVKGQFEEAKVKDNDWDSAKNAAKYVTAPSLTWGEMDFHPLDSALSGSELDLAPFTSQFAHDLDFDGQPKGAASHRGAFAESGTDSCWRIEKAMKPSAGVAGRPAASD